MVEYTIDLEIKRNFGFDIQTSDWQGYFRELRDTPDDYSGSGNYYIRVKSSEDGLELVSDSVFDHDFGGDVHNADTLNNVNTNISDATLDDSGDSRPPQDHNNSAHSETYITDITGESIGNLSNVDTSGVTDTQIIEYDAGTDTWVVADNAGGVSKPITQNVQDLGSISGTGTSSVDIDVTQGTQVRATLTGDTEFTFSGSPASGEVTDFELRLTDADQYAITWPSGTLFDGSTAPDIIGNLCELPCQIDANGVVTVYGVIDDIG